MKEKGVLLSGFTNPLLFIFHDEEDMKGHLVVKKYNSIHIFRYLTEEMKDYIKANKTIEFGH